MRTQSFLITMLMLLISASAFAGYSVFDQPVSYTGGIGMVQLTSADLNGDNYADIVTANSGSNSVRVMLNDGTGSFFPSASYNLGTSQRAVTAVDIDMDSDRDLVIVTGGSIANLIILLNAGDGTFTLDDTYDVGDFPIAVKAADLDSGNDKDLVTANWNDGTVTVLLNDGNGDYPTSVTYVVGSAGSQSARDIAIADLDNDNDKDIVVLHESDASVVLLLNDGNGVFTNGGTAILSNDAISVSVADLNLDGTIDIAATIPSEGKVALLFNSGSAMFGAPDYLNVGDEPRAIDMGDLDSDGDVDIVISDNTATVDDVVSILWNTGNGTFGDPDIYETGDNMPLSVTIDDFDKNGNSDVAVVHFLTFASGDVSLLYNLLPSAGTSACPCCTAAPGDLNGDAMTDIADLVYFVNFMFAGGFSPICE